jgi:hypothetical protein
LSPGLKPGARPRGCANPLSGSGGANGVINVLWPQSCGSFFMNRYWTDANRGAESFLASGNAVGNQAIYSSPGGTCWGGFNLFAPEQPCGDGWWTGASTSLTGLG